MGGFKQQSINEDFQKGFYDHIVETIEKCCNLMKQNCISSGRKVKNHEVNIQNHLFYYYLDKNSVLEELECDMFPISFQIETPETYDEDTDTFIGRCDIRVTSNNYWVNKNKEDYYIIECKRIDGSSRLNNKYIDEGVFRFVDEPPKYPTCHNKNIMFGFVVKDIDIQNNSKKLSVLNKKKFKFKAQGDLSVIKADSSVGLYEYISDYALSDKPLQLLHIFFDFSPLIRIS
ncbi:hypothetical protein [Fusibacter sp. JL216-2]|uniref:hypothetical protein n=1 Tax=Fusibacter sp. JL216-2 TaxID=3071453 RepID=UPI003D332B10